MFFGSKFIELPTFSVTCCVPSAAIAGLATVLLLGALGWEHAVVSANAAITTGRTTKRNMMQDSSYKLVMAPVSEALVSRLPTGCRKNVAGPPQPGRTPCTE